MGQWWNLTYKEAFVDDLHEKGLICNLNLLKYLKGSYHLAVYVDFSKIPRLGVVWILSTVPLQQCTVNVWWWLNTPIFCSLDSAWCYSNYVITLPTPCMLLVHLIGIQAPNQPTFMIRLPSSTLKVPIGDSPTRRLISTMGPGPETYRWTAGWDELQVVVGVQEVVMCVSAWWCARLS